eukprot:2692817-Pyramimonas_sp.AAC.1
MDPHTQVIRPKFALFCPSPPRQVNTYDGVPRVPLLLNYRHVHHAVYIDKDGTVFPKPPLEIASAPGYVEGVVDSEVRVGVACHIKNRIAY